MTPAELFAARVRANPASPLLTCYDDSTGERVELSATTTANWVAKTANLLQDGLGVEPGERVAVVLPLHWQAAVVMLACWSVGAVVALDAEGADVVFAPETADADEVTVERARSLGARDVVGLSLRPLGGPLATPVDGVTDYARDVLAYPDEFAPYATVDDGRPALRVIDTEWTGRALVADATETAAGVGMHSRVLTVTSYGDEDAVRLGLLAPLAAGGSVVLCRHPDAGALASRATVERVTATVGVDVPGLPRVG